MSERVTENEIKGALSPNPPRPRVTQPPAQRENMTARSVWSLSGALKTVFSNQLARVGPASETLEQTLFWHFNRFNVTSYLARTAVSVAKLINGWLVG